MLSLAIVGAGPYGLSLAAHLRAAGVGFRIFGKPMEAWKRGMPEGMLLKSHPWSSCLSDPQGKLTLANFCADRRIDYHDSRMHLPLQTFVEYGEAFQSRFAPDAAPKTLVELGAIEGGGFRAVFDDGEIVEAQRVVLAVGVHPFKFVPAVLAGLPPGLVSHSGDYGGLAGLDGKEVVVIGGGASAIDLAALLHERGVAVSMVVRASALKFASPPAHERSWLRNAVRPSSGIGTGWYLWACANTPELFRTLPGPMRRRLVRDTLGPLGGAVMRDRLLGKVPLSLGCEILGAEQVGDRIRLRVRQDDGALMTLEADHVIAATGYRIDFSRLGFITPQLASRIRLDEGAPVLSGSYETSARGLHVIGPASAFSFGPVSRFVFGAPHPSRSLARYFATQSPRGASLARPAAIPDVGGNT